LRGLLILSGYQARTFLDGKQLQKSMKTDNLKTAFKLAEDWYRKLLRSSVQVGKKHLSTGSDPTIADLFKSSKQTHLPAIRKVGCFAGVEEQAAVTKEVQHLHRAASLFCSAAFYCRRFFK
jgi:hypothetical protein